MSVSLAKLLEDNTMPAAPELVRDEGDQVVRCLACGHCCRIAEGKAGICRVRFNRGGKLYAPAGYVAGLAVDPIEKKPFFHAFPGRDALSFGMLGCDLHCAFCQNWISSQTLRDERAVSLPHRITADQVLAVALQRQTPVMVSTYNEPLITADWAVEIFKSAREHEIVCGFVSNGHATPDVLRFLRPYVDLYKVDLKCFSQENYRKLGGSLQVVLDSIALLKAMGFWVEIVTLIIPTFNDGDQELGDIARFIAGVSMDIPWHVTAFHPDYKMSDPPATPASTLKRAYEIGCAAGLKFVYAGNLAGSVGDRENTHCPACGELLIRRSGFHIEENRMTGGHCPGCHADIPGVWEPDAPRRSDDSRFPRAVGF
ncbi:MAG: AmmeMemoRadiSam system radical SAM enzyme [Phycisphaerales bacterium]|nr:AmmeMemoRadiSam system radical SAM enzyme [Phycisphaerales bacterium]